MAIALGPLSAILITADRTPEVRSLADRDGIAQLNKPVKPAALSRVAGTMKAAEGHASSPLAQSSEARQLRTKGDPRGDWRHVGLGI
jgi:hypothetical protein